MKKSLFLLLSVFSIAVYGGTFTSQVSGPWNTPATWSVVGDADGIPDADDDVTIVGGHTVTNNVANSTCRDLTVQGILSTGTSMVLYIRRNYSVTGTESGNGAIAFLTAGHTISGGGSFGANVRYTFSAGATRTILAGTSITKLAPTGIASSTVTNLGTVSLGTVNTSAGATWINSTNSTLVVRTAGFMNGRTFTAHASGNSVNITFAAGNLPLTTAGYFNLRLQATGAGTKTMTTDLVLGGLLTINSLNTLNTNNFNLSIAGNWTKNGTFTSSANRTVTFNGTTAQTIAGTGTTTFQGLAISNTAGVSITSGTYLLNEVLTISNGTFNTGGNSFTMVSTAVATARIAPITGTGAIAGNFTVQRFISSRTQDPTDDPGHWTDLASPVQSSTMADWDNELFLSYASSPPTVTANVYAFSEPLADWVAVTAATTLTPGRGFEIALTDDGTLTSFSNTTLNTIGVPNNGNQNLSSLISFSADGENLVGNPFASSISWTSVFGASSGILNTFDVYEADAGTYVTYGLGDEIAAGQGFWVYTTMGGATLNVPETAKTTSSNSSIREMNLNQPYFSLTLKNAGRTNPYYHTLKIAASSEASDGWDINDHPFRKSPNKNAPSITSKTFDNKELSINTFNSSNENYSLPLTTKVGHAGSYVLEVSGIEFMTDYTCVSLEDKKTGKFFDLSLNNILTFELNSDTEERFTLHFSKDSDCRSSISSSFASALESNIQILPSAEGNIVSFNMNENTPLSIEVVNVMGQQILDTKQIIASSQSENIVLPVDFSGMYLIRITSETETVVKKFVRK